MEAVIITGLSGSGKSKAADWFEDKGYYCIDNMPPALIKNFIELSTGEKKIDKVAFVVDIRGGRFFDDLKETITSLQENVDIDLKILFIEASDRVLVRRFKEVRRQHPLAQTAITIDNINEERELLAELRENATHIIDTTNLKVAEFHSELDHLFHKKSKETSFSLKFVSFGYKHRIPSEADWVLDVRFIPNPYYVASLKKLTGNNKKIQQYVLKHEITQDFIKNTSEMIHNLIPYYIKEGKYSLTVAFGCTGGQHRSVTLANEFYKIFTEEGWRVTLEHKEL
ncbi:MAG: RNase adapter RapZ [Firmicutes bacterium]|nr:RNase adapter RapZ [Bacillota bacterium]